MSILSPRASFTLDGSKVWLNTRSMAKNSEGFYEKKLPGGLTVLWQCDRPTADSLLCMLRLRNDGEENTGRITLPKTVDLQLPLQTPSVKWHSLAGDRDWAESFLPLHEVLEEGTEKHVEPFGGRSANITGFPYFDMQFDDASLVCGIGWTGQWSQDLAVKNSNLLISVSLCDADFVLYPGEEVRLPSFFMVEGDSDVAAARRRFRRICIEQFSPKAILGHSPLLPVAAQPFDRYFWDDELRKNWACVEGQKRTIDIASEIPGIDTYWLDAAWFYKGFPDGVGNYRFEPSFPNGLKEVSDHARSKGLRFMLWFEPERIHEGSDTYADYPQFLLSYPEEDHQKLFNLGNDEARTWLKNTLISFIRDNGVDIYRQDFNFEPLPYWRATDTEGRKGITEMKYVAGLYDLWDSIHAAFPGMLIDNCASGGRRIDFETCRRALPLWRSDTGCHGEDEEYRISVWNNNQILAITEYIPYQAAGIWHMETYDFRAAANSGVACNFDYLGDFDAEQCKKILAELTHLRPYWEGDFYPMTEPTLEENVWSAYRLRLEDRGMCWFFRREQCPDAEKTFCITDVNPDRKYQLTFIDDRFVQTKIIVTGCELINGITVTIPEKRNSLLMKYQEL